MDSDEDNRPAERRLVKLKKVKTKHQDVDLSDSEIAMARRFEQQTPKASLSNDEITLINIFEKKKLFLANIAIMFNQTRATLGMSLLKKEDLLGLLDGLKARGLVATRPTPSGEDVFYLTDEGLEFAGIA